MPEDTAAPPPGTPPPTTPLPLPAEPIPPESITETDFTEASHTFHLLGSPIRTHVLWLLSQHEYDVSTLAERVGTTVPTLSHHLSKLRLAHLVSVRPHGRHHIYSVDDPHLIALVEAAVEHHADLRLNPPPAG